LNHAWGAAPGNIIVRKLMGVEPISPGFDTFQIKPQVGKLTFASLKTPTIKGLVSVVYEKKAQQNTLEVSIPGGTVAMVYLPYDPQKPHLFVDGKKTSLVPQAGFYLIKNLHSGKHVLTTQ
jgi:hypothetical protein